MIKKLIQKQPWRNPVGRSVALLKSVRQKNDGFEEDFASAWLPEVSMEEWESFLSSEPNDESRIYCYDYIRRICDGRSNLDFAEIGFGQCRDFHSCFKTLQDEGRITYHGYDVTEQFIRYARRKFPEYEFQSGGFITLNECDISYTRHTLEHQNPKEYQECLKSLLARTREECIIVWFIPPSGHEELKWVPKIGITTNSGAYLNRYSVENVDPIIDAAGFDLRKVRVAGNVVYHCRRHTAI